MHSWLRVALVVVLAGVTTPAPAPVQLVRQQPAAGSSYDGRLVFVRLRWGTGSIRSGGWNSAWNHDYPRAEQHFTKILDTVTFIDVRLDDTLILTLDDPELFKYPIAYMWEPGFWTVTDHEAACFRDYLLKGGFAVFEDFEREQWANFEAQMARVVPGARWVKLDASHLVFDTFFRMKTIEFPHPMLGYKPSYYGLFEDNDPSKRLMAIADYDNDVPEYWEWSNTGLFAVDTSNEAYKLGVNYMIYAMTH